MPGIVKPEGKFQIVGMIEKINRKACTFELRSSEPGKTGAIIIRYNQSDWPKIHALILKMELVMVRYEKKAGRKNVEYWLEDISHFSGDDLFASPRLDK